MPRDSRDYGVKLVRGPFVALAPHRDHCDDIGTLKRLVARMRSERPDVRLAADLFSGAGGMSLGLARAGFGVVFSADHDPDAIKTHAAHFPGMAVDWDLAEPDNVQKVGDLLAELGVDLLAGGPPCQPFSKAGRSGIRDRVRNGLRDPHDQRRDLWRSFLEVVELARPAAVLMENVPDMALDREMFILRSMTEELEQLGYNVEERVVDSREYGVPQFRQRLIVSAVRDGGAFEWPPVTPQQVTVWNAIGDMPEVEGGWRPEGGAAGWAPYEGPVTSYQHLMREGVRPGDTWKLHDHITRPVREDDALAFEHMDATTRYSELPESVKRYREDIFDDKYKRLDENDLSRTITAHIAKDGYWYIHPRQGRTITVREAARLQSFPDSFRFVGPPSAAFRQIGNAVPPLLAQRLGEAVQRSLVDQDRLGTPTHESSAALASWFSEARELTVPWLKAPTRWLVICAEVLFDRMPGEQSAHLWPALQRWTTPAETLQSSEELRELASWVGREERADRIIRIAAWLEEHPGVLDNPELEGSAVPELAAQHADLAVLAVPTEADAEEPVLVTKSVLRVARRFFGEETAADDQLLNRQNKLTDGRLAVARLVGFSGESRAAHLGLIELSARVCLSRRPLCEVCPLVAMCMSGRRTSGVPTA